MQTNSQQAENIAPVILQVRGIHKRFPGVHVLRGINFDLRRGEVHALVGENGAGKSTLMHILAGVHQPDEGEIEINGLGTVTLGSEQQAQDAGIAIVFQERSLFSTLNLAENIFAGRQPVDALGKINRRKLYLESERLLREVGLSFPPQTPLSELSPAQQQMVEIAKALSLQAKVIIFDEPTAALTDTETRALFRVIDQLKKQGVGVIYISHRLEEIFQIGDRVTVLKDGTWQGTLPIAETNPNDLVARMVGRELSLHQRHSDETPESNPIVLEVRALSDAAEYRRSRPYLHEISFKVRSGEIVVFAGLAGAGRTELALSIFGARKRASGELFINGQQVQIDSPSDAIAAGIGYASEDRKDTGLFLDMDVTQNVAAARLEDFGSWWMNDSMAASTAERFRQQLRIATSSVQKVVRNLSGGNQQKVVLSKWLLVNPKILIVDEPTRGIDVGAKAEVHALLHQLSRKGTAVIVISSDLPEVLAVADRILVMREGTIAGELSGNEATEQKVMQLATITLQER